ncbi:odorant receptor 131-2-like [Channa argus]|uniref:odorant receptor 131-2-like n=1 Tax=Channa argus TaxID=215402 RepID=UPI0035207D67
MNVSSANATVDINNRDSFIKAVTKNVIVVVLSICINYINASLIQTFCKNQIFYTNPRYILFFHLVVNDMMQVTLTVILFIISYILYKIKVSICCTVILIALFTTENTPLNLACMAVECYIAICLPLHHPQICTVKRTSILISLIWAVSMLSVVPDLFITLATESLDFFNSQVFCLRETVFRNTHLIKKRDITYITYLGIVWFIIFFTYFKIMFTAKTASKDATKARNTILIHGFQVLLCMATYAEPLLKNALLLWFPMNYSDSLFACYIIIQILPRSISPIIYGIRDKTFRKYLKRYLLCVGRPETKVFYQSPLYILFIHLVIKDMIHVTVTVLCCLSSATP